MLGTAPARELGLRTTWREEGGAGKVISSSLSLASLDSRRTRRSLDVCFLELILAGVEGFWGKQSCADMHLACLWKNLPHPCLLQGYAPLPLKGPWHLAQALRPGSWTEAAADTGLALPDRAAMMDWCRLLALSGPNLADLEWASSRGTRTH